MGIPGLLSTLEPYAEHEFLDGRRVVIDGPAFAYHILHKCTLSGRIEPSNELLGRSAVAWLDELPKHGISVEAVYFDGYLPSTKRLVRFQRTERITSQLIKRRKTFHLTLPPFENRKCLNHDELFQIAGTPQPQKAPPLPPPFHVPAVIEALQNSTYADVTHLVPGEADDFCAKLAYDAIMPICVLTSDSDLMCHDFEHGTVALFRDVYVNSDDKLVCNLYNSREISTSLGFPVIRLAYERERDQHTTMNQLRRICLENQPDPRLWRLFKKRYTNDQMAEPIADWKLDILDPRLSELIYQFSRNQVDPLIFMPMMTEDPSRRSVWDTASELRTMAYTFAAHGFPKPPKTMREYRKITNVHQHKGTLVKLSMNKALAYLDELESLVERFETEAQATPTHFLWTRFALAVAIRDDLAASGSSPILNTLRNPKICRREGKYIWEEAHFVAQILAALHSLRMVKQVFLALPETAYPELSGRLTEWSAWLQRIVPSLKDYPSTDLLLSILRDEGSAKRLLRDIGEKLDVPNLEKDEEDRTGSEGDSDDGEDGTHGAQKSAPRSTGNPFDLLAMDE